MRHPKGGPHYDGALDEDTWVAISGYGPTKATVIDGGELLDDRASPTPAIALSPPREIWRAFQIDVARIPVLGPWFLVRESVLSSRVLGPRRTKGRRTQEDDRRRPGT